MLYYTTGEVGAYDGSGFSSFLGLLSGAFALSFFRGTSFSC